MIKNMFYFPINKTYYIYLKNKKKEKKLHTVTFEKIQSCA